jgi:hypothetical protein
MLSGWSSPKKLVKERIQRPFQVSAAQDRFIMALLGQSPPDELQHAYEWYMDFLECKILEAWKPFFSRVLRDIDPFPDLPSANALSIAFEMLEITVIDLERENLALIDVVDKLYNNKTLIETDYERSHANQLLFAVIGWISMLICMWCFLGHHC